MPSVRNTPAAGQAKNKMSKLSQIIHDFLTSGKDVISPSTDSPYYNEDYFDHLITLTGKGDIRFGPSYFDLWIDNAKLDNRNFGRSIWLLDDCLFGAEEWLTTSERIGPLTRLVIFDLSKMKCVPFSRISGFPKDVKIASGNIKYIRDEYKSKKETLVPLNSKTKWRPIFGCRW